jgi:TonB-dependent SusC/RagA subfamily outer membrane receptor
MYTNYTNYLCMPQGYISKLLLIMKLTTFILIMTLMQVSAATFGQNFTLREKNVSIAKVFFEIRKQTGYDVLLETSKLKTSQKINAEFNNIPVKDVIDQIIKGTELEYTFNDKTIFIKQKDKSFFERMADRFQAIDVRGKVVDENGQPLSGATIKVKGTNVSTSSDSEGEFFLLGVADGAVIQISFLGFKTREIKAANKLGEIRMEIGNSQLDEVMISTGYFSTTKAKSTMNISKVDGKEIENQPVTTLVNSLVGRVAGLDITPVNGVPGTASAVRIRGNNSLSPSGANLLYVVDGVQLDFEGLRGTAFFGIDPLASISPANIESIEVLKDAAATAIYGSRGANGVIRITTKKANARGDNNLNINLYTGVGKVVNKVDLLNREQYLAMRLEAFKNNGTNPGFFDHDLNGKWDTSRETDWQDELLGGSAKVNDFQASYSGGNNFTSFRLGGGYHKETTIFPGEFNFQRGTADFSFNHRSDDNNLEVQAGLSYGWVDNRTNGTSSIITDALNLPPIAPKLYNEDGTINWEIKELVPGFFLSTFANPMASMLNTDRNVSNSLISNAQISYQILDGLKIKGSVSLSNIYNKGVSQRPIASFSPLGKTLDL